MTALCAGGTSAAKPLTELAVTYSAGRLSQLLVAAGVSELSAFLPLLFLAPVLTSTFCASDPPSMTALTTAEATALATQDFGADYLSGVGKLKDILLNLAWNDLCECTSGSYTAPVAPASPSGTPVLHAPVAPSVLPCIDSGTLSHTIIAGGSAADSSASLFGLNYSSVVFIGDNVIADSTQTSTHQLYWANQAGTLTSLTSFNISQASPGPKTRSVLLPAGVDHLVSVPQSAGLTGHSYDFTDSFQVYCGGQQPGGVQQPCCPPDVATQAMLDQILRAVTLIQRQGVPFGYVTGSVHSGLSGAGSIAVTGLLGAKIDITTLPDSYGREGSSPEEHFDLGFISWGNPDGWPVSYRVDKDPTLTFPRVAAVFTTIDYDLSPGLVVTITELLKEP